jgi:hypothetical protein
LWWSTRHHGVFRIRSHGRWSRSIYCNVPAVACKCRSSCLYSWAHLPMNDGRFRSRRPRMNSIVFS